MPLTIQPLHQTLAAEITGVDIAQGVDAATVAALEAANNRYPVLVLRGQKIDKEQQVAFAGMFGPLELPSLRLRSMSLRAILAAARLTAVPAVSKVLTCASVSAVLRVTSRPTMVTGMPDWNTMRDASGST